ncbi:Dam family site-specific DNA-(adenine-N6)-methyltransferase [Duganella sp. FT92W]|uniref:Site-specific DNA-methyltransferase (adenine-specific) n=1 Tax=Pseudoduganella rivuli TaxID=2666085 RepID=A0A7X2IU29_9BURK|nr:Dam family site-specific DNA-(adenine-N6)-methyltransferase [Pseudoduganella rivuli]MRV75802.1 Dam family site-specific DNA-(adenine-N6)-methyltransferase [Pseudoduganella rivuli]
MSFLRWAGSKKQLGDILENCWYAAQTLGGSGRYIEAFCGSASLFFRLKPKAGILIDVNQPLVEMYEVVKTSPRKLSALINEFPIGESFYYELRDSGEYQGSKLSRAARFIYLNRFCFNGLYRTNREGKFNVPFGAGRNGSLPTLDQLLQASQSLRDVRVLNDDFSVIRKNVKKGDFVYLDPPYAKRNHSLDLQYGPDVFGVDDLSRLYSLLEYIDKKGAYFVFSYVQCDEVKEFVKTWAPFEVQVKRTIAADISKRGRATELLISNI